MISHKIMFSILYSIRNSFGIFYVLSLSYLLQMLITDEHRTLIIFLYRYSMRSILHLSRFISEEFIMSEVIDGNYLIMGTGNFYYTMIY